MATTQRYKREQDGFITEPLTEAQAKGLAGFDEQEWSPVEEWSPTEWKADDEPVKAAPRRRRAAATKPDEAVPPASLESTTDAE